MEFVGKNVVRVNFTWTIAQAERIIVAARNRASLDDELRPPTPEETKTKKSIEEIQEEYGHPEGALTGAGGEHIAITLPPLTVTQTKAFLEAMQGLNWLR